MDPMGLYQASWSSPVTNRLLIQGGAAAALDRFPAAYNPGVSPNDIFHQRAVDRPEVAATPNEWVPARNFAEVTDVPAWKT